MQIILKSVKEITPYERNPRSNENAVGAVAESIKQFGFRVPIVIDKNNIIVAGHTRLKAAKLLGYKEVPCVIADDLTDEQVKAYRLADNKTSELSSWDIDLLAAELGGITDIDMSDFGFDDEDEKTDIIEDDFNIVLPEEPKSKLGDIYKLGRHRLLCGDSMDIDNIKKLTDGAEISLLMTDPPYNVGYENDAGVKIQNDNMKAADFRKFLISVFRSADSVMKAGAAFYIWHSDSESTNFKEACTTAGWNVKQCLVWVKNSLVLSRQDYQWKHEPCLYGWKDGAAHFWNGGRKQRTTITDFDICDLRTKKKDELLNWIEKYLCDREDFETSVIYEERPTKSTEHPTMKPVRLIARLIRNSLKPDDNVLDIFGGSGTTIIACEQLGINCYMAELEPKYIDVIIERWEKFTGEKAVKII